MQRPGLAKGLLIILPTILVFMMWISRGLVLGIKMARELLFWEPIHCLFRVKKNI